ncbi:hypothetical protein FNF29_02702 [Cafeteria roenbergensis]|uniref:Uncharacterized protein n=1 Tax=Cafeteria roenbergensis TaxID=33653 RepID=A0A5A8CMU5_CAFRO|nr:hypothetical protein FNF29_02702 [Cafeteria roenbergensis]|eukprot:KAA0154079.1 hypothetical protein FNF29_02702 [Cafeteria roenbergensis]
MAMASLEASMPHDDPFADPATAGAMPILPGTTVPLGPGPLAAGLLAACGGAEPARQAINMPGMDLALDLPGQLASPALSAGATPMLPFAPPTAALAPSQRDAWGAGASGAFGAMPGGASDDEDEFDDARSDASSLVGHTGASLAPFGFGGAGDDDDDDDDDDDESEIPGSRAAARRRRNSMRRDRRAAGGTGSRRADLPRGGLAGSVSGLPKTSQDVEGAPAASSSDAPEGSDATSARDLPASSTSGADADVPQAQSSFLAPTSRFWEYFCGTTLPKWTWALLEDEPGVAALRRGALEGAIRNLRMSRWWVSRAVAETAYDHLDAFLRHYHGVRRDQQSASAMTSDRVRMAGGRVLVGDRFTEDASCLVELMAAHIEVVAHEHSVMTGDVPPGHTEWVAGQAEMLTRTAISLARTRPILDAHFGTLATAMARLISCRPATGVTVLRRLLASWPRRDCSREVPWLRLTQTTLMATPPPMVKGSSVWTPLFNQLLRCMGSDHQEVACSAIDILSGSMSALLGIIGDRKMRETAKKTLVNNESHWSDNVRDKSADLFDAMLDLE